MASREKNLPDAIDRIKGEASDALNSYDAGMAEQGQAALEKVIKDLDGVKAEAVRNTNGAAPTLQVVKGGATAAEPEPQNLDAEEAVIGAILMSPNVLAKVSVELAPSDFYRESHGFMFQACLDLVERGGKIDAITVARQLEEKGQLKNVGGKERVHEIAALVPASANVMHYASIVRRVGLERGVLRATKLSPLNPEAIAEAAGALTRHHVAGDARRALDGAEWLAAQPEGCPCVWGEYDRVLWAEGEPLMIYGPDGVGKTSLAQQIVLALCGIRLEPLLGLPIPKSDRPVLYLACDRPKQARRSFFRMVPREMHELLKGRLLVWEGPLPFQIPTQTKALLDFALLHEAGYVVIDSLKDVAVDLTKPETALRVNQAFQWCSASGVELLVLHHPRKDPAGTPSKAKTLEDVYGDRNFVAGMGSVVALYGKGGDPIVDLAHLKQPAGEVGPYKVLHDHDTGTSVLYESKTLGDILVDAGRPLLVAEVAARFYGVPDPERNHMEKVRRELRKLVSENQAVEMKGDEGLAFAAL